MRAAARAHRFADGSGLIGEFGVLLLELARGLHPEFGADLGTAAGDVSHDGRQQGSHLVTKLGREFPNG